MGIEMRSVRVRGWRIKFKQVLKTGKVYTSGAKSIDGKTKDDVISRLAQFRKPKEAKGITFIEVSEPFQFDEEQHFLCL